MNSAILFAILSGLSAAAWTVCLKLGSSRIRDWGPWARNGALLAYGPNVTEMTPRAAGYLDRVLKGAKPADLPFPQPTKFDLIVNTTVAKGLGLPVPQSILVRADQVIE